MKFVKFLFVNFFLICLILNVSYSEESLPGNITQLNINNWNYWQESNGVSKPTAIIGGGFFPTSSSRVVYCDGLIWGGYVNDPDQSKPQLRAGGVTYSSSMQPGSKDITGLDKIYRYRQDAPQLHDAYLAMEAMDYYGITIDKVTPLHKENIFNNYVENRNNWPSIAPFYDRNRNGIWDVDFDEPGIVDSDQLLWYCSNDFDDVTSKSLYGSPPIGLELQTTIWAYKHSEGILANTIFKKYKLENKSKFRIDSMFVGQFIDTDINDVSNDFGGCDSTLNFGYGYNSELMDDGYENVAPAVGYVLLQGPIVQSEGDEAIYNFEKLQNYRNLNMTSMVVKPTGVGWADPDIHSYSGTIQLYHLLNGNIPQSVENQVIPFREHNEQNGKPTKFVCNGNPDTGEGDIDGQFNNMPPGDRRFYMGCGPFTMEPGDVQEIVFAVVGGQGEDNIESVAKLYEAVPILHDFWESLVDWEEPVGQAQSIDKVDHDLGISEFILDHSYPNPFNSNVNFRFVLFGDMDVDLNIYNLQGKLVKNIQHEILSAGEYEVSWNGSGNNGTSMPAGVYLVSLKSDAKIQTRKIVYLK